MGGAAVAVSGGRQFRGFGGGGWAHRRRDGSVTACVRSAADASTGPSPWAGAGHSGGGALGAKLTRWRLGNFHAIGRTAHAGLGRDGRGASRIAAAIGTKAIPAPGAGAGDSGSISCIAKV